MAGKKAEQPSKAAKAKSAMSGGKAKKKKWSKAKTKEKVTNLVLFDKATYEKMIKEVPQWKLITPSVMVERLKINGSLARAGLRDLINKGLVKQVASNNAQLIYTRATAATA